MDNNAVTTLANGLRSFSSSIRVTTYDDPSSLVTAALDREPRMVYYFHGCSMRYGYGYCEFMPQFINKTTPLSDIRTVTSKVECVNYLCLGAGNLSRKVIVVVNNNVDLSAVLEEFESKHYVRYPNLRSVSTNGYHSFGNWSVYEFGLEYRIGKVKLEMMEIEVNREVERIARLLFVAGMPAEAKIYLAHNYIASTVTYVKNRQNDLRESYTQSAYGALIKHECVCQGYAEAFWRLMSYAGIKCELVCGQIVGSSEHHAWNVVSPSEASGYYHIDVTWDDTAPFFSRYDYFGKSDAFFIGKRVWNRSFTPACRGTQPIIDIARNYIRANKAMLLRRGIDPAVLDC